MTTHGKESGFAFLSTTFGFDLRSGRKPMDLAAIAAIDIDNLVQSKSGLNLAPLQETLDDLVFGVLPAAANGRGDASSRLAAFDNLFELGQLSCEKLLADQDVLVQRLEAAQRGTNKARKRTLAYRDRARGYTSQANDLKTSNVRRAVSLRKLQNYVLDARERAEAAEEGAQRRIEPALGAGTRVVGNKENQRAAPLTRAPYRLGAATNLRKRGTANIVAPSRSREVGSSSSGSSSGGGKNSSALLHPWLTQPVHAEGKRIVGPSGVFDASRSEASRNIRCGGGSGGGGGDQPFSSTYPSSNAPVGWRPRTASSEVQGRRGGNKRREVSSAQHPLAASAPAGVSHSSYNGNSRTGRHLSTATTSSQDRTRWVRTGNLRVDEIATALEVLDRRRLSEARAAAATGDFTRDQGDAYEDEYDNCSSSRGDATEDNSDEEYMLGRASNVDDFDGDEDDDDDDSGLVADAGEFTRKVGEEIHSSGLSTRSWAEGEVTLGLSLHHDWDKTGNGGGTGVVDSAHTTMLQHSTMAVTGSKAAPPSFDQRSSNLAATANGNDDDNDTNQHSYKVSHVGKFFATTAAVSSLNGSEGDDDSSRDNSSTISKAPSMTQKVEPPASPRSRASGDAGSDEILQVSSIKTRSNSSRSDT